MILVVGGTGYIGRYFCCEAVKREIDVLALGRSEKAVSFLKDHGVKTQYFDINDPESYRALPSDNVDAIIVLSAKLAELETPVEEFFNVNTLGVYRILDFAQKVGIKKVVITSSHKVYNDVEKEIISEDDAISFKGDHSPYIISKIAAENFVTYYNKDFDMKAVALRLTGVRGYGEILGQLNADHSYRKSAFEIFFEKSIKAEPIEVWGDQKIKRDHVYIKDVVNALFASVDAKDASGIYNIASGIGYSQYEEAVAVADIFGPENHKSEVNCLPEKKGLERGYVYRIDKAKSELNWEPEFADIRKMYVDYKKEWERKVFHNYHVFLEGQAPATL